jgi:rhodanese-related sulfurtransferase
MANFYMYNIKRLLCALIFGCSISGLFASDEELIKKIDIKYLENCGDFQVPTITAKSLSEIISNKDIVLVDVRDTKEREVSFLQNSISVDEFNKNKDMYKNKTIIAYCTIGYRSGIFAKKYSKYKVQNLIGGVLMWSHVNGQFFNTKGPTKDVHVYSDSWDFLNSKYRAVK